MPNNEEIQDQIDLYKELNSLQEDYINAGKDDSTIENRVAAMQEAVAHADDNVKLSEISKNLMEEANRLVKIGHVEQAKKYIKTVETIGAQIVSNKKEEENLKIQKKLIDEKHKQANALNGMAKSTLGMIGLGGGLVAIFSKFNEMTKTIGKEFGALGMQNEEFKDDILEAGAAAASLGQDIKAVASISGQLSKDFGFGRNESVGMAQGIMDTSMALGLSNEEGTTLIGTLMQISGLSFDAAQNFSKQTQLLAEAEGVSPQAVLKDIAKSSKTIAEFTAMTPENLAKAAIQATKLGTTLDTIAGSMKSMLSFQDSLNAEIEASIMLGRSVNLQKARELALAGEAEAFAVEITRQVGSQAEFERMNVLQRQSLAKALGVSVEQMAKMVNNQDKVRTIGEAIANQPGLEKMIGREALDSMAKIVADLQRVGAELIISIGPTVAMVAEGIAKFTKGLSESVGIIPVITGLLGLMLGKSILNFVFTAATALGLQAGFLGPIGMGLILGIPAIIGGMLGGLMQLQTGTEIGGIKADGVVAQLHQGETVLNKKDSAILGAAVNGGGMTKQDMESAVAGGVKGLVEENKKVRQQNQELISVTKNQAALLLDGIRDFA